MRPPKNLISKQTAQLAAAAIGAAVAVAVAVAAAVIDACIAAYATAAVAVIAAATVDPAQAADTAGVAAFAAVPYPFVSNAYTIATTASGIGAAVVSVNCGTGSAAAAVPAATEGVERRKTSAAAH